MPKRMIKGEIVSQKKKRKIQDDMARRCWEWPEEDSERMEGEDKGLRALTVEEAKVHPGLQCRVEGINLQALEWWWLINTECECGNNE
jgi:hypothetical protein